MVATKSTLWYTTIAALNQRSRKAILSSIAPLVHAPKCKRVSDGLFFTRSQKNLQNVHRIRRLVIVVPFSKVTPDLDQPSAHSMFVSTGHDASWQQGDVKHHPRQRHLQDWISAWHPDQANHVHRAADHVHLTTNNVPLAGGPWARRLVGQCRLE